MVPGHDGNCTSEHLILSFELKVYSGVLCCHRTNIVLFYVTISEMNKSSKKARVQEYGNVFYIPYVHS